AIREYAVGCCKLYRCDRAGPQCHCQVLRLLVDVKAKDVSNVSIIQASGLTAQQGAAYDVIVVSGSLEIVPQVLQDWSAAP
ncbi:hypothetical protein ACO0K4_19775, partial [Undibacterium sp. RuTC16W]